MTMSRSAFVHWSFAIQMTIAAACAAVEPGTSALDAGEAEVVVRSPRGTFRIEHRLRPAPPGEPAYGYDSFIVPENPGDGSAVALESSIEPIRHYWISPDERWIYAEFKLYTRRSSCELFERKKGFEFIKVFSRQVEDGGNFDEAMWAFFSRTTGLSTAEYPRLCDFVAWAPDSSRLLVGLRGVAAPKGAKVEEVETAPGVYGWNVYWNTGKRAFELTNSLKKHNAQAAKRWAAGGKGTELGEPFCAEPLGPLPSIDELDRQIADVRAKIDQAWSEAAADKQKEAGERPWPEVEKRATAWRQVRMAGVEKTAATFAQRWPEKEREQWRRLSLRGRLEAVLEEIQRQWPWAESP